MWGEDMAKKRLRFWNIPVTQALDEAVEKAVRKNAHVSKSDFVRDAVREKLRKMGLLEEPMDLFGEAIENE
jgi:metal-responsive CopG/Arc/MetJ family transcriptional regulator